jgi:hypothetical protein
VKPVREGREGRTERDVETNFMKAMDVRVDQDFHD